MILSLESSWRYRRPRAIPLMMARRLFQFSSVALLESVTMLKLVNIFLYQGSNIRICINMPKLKIEGKIS